MTQDLSKALAGLSPAQRAVLRTRLGAQGSAAPSHIPRRPDQSEYPLSFPQEALWLINELEPGPQYNDYAGFHIKGPLDRSILSRAIDEIVRRHEILRAVFPGVDGRPVQIIRPPDPVLLPLLDLTGRPAASAWEAARVEAQAPFSLADGPLIRVKLIRLSAEDHFLLITMHHIVTDGWSFGIFMQEIVRLYQAYYERDQSLLMPELPIQYADFAAWQRNQLQGDQLERELAYWRSHLSGAVRSELLPSSNRRTGDSGTAGNRSYIEVPRNLVEALKELSRRESVSLVMTLMTALNIVLARYSGRDEAIIGAPIAGRDQIETHSLIGVFVNTLVVRTDLSGNPTIREAIARVKQVVLGAFAHQRVPFAALVRELKPERNTGQIPYFQVLFNSQPAPTSSSKQFCGLTVSPIDADNQQAPFDLTLQLTEEGDGMQGRLHYKTSIFTASAIERIWTHYVRVLQAMIVDPGARISEVELLTPAEKKLVLGKWQGKGEQFGPAELLHEEFRRTALQYAERDAVICEGDKLTYAELDRQSERLAAHLTSLGVGLESRVGICLERNSRLVVGILGILKAGAAYVPLDPAYPRERVHYIVADAGVKLVVTESGTDSLVPDDVQRVYTEQIGDDLAGAQLAPVDSTNADRAAYIMYTSGSTGRPKGVVVSHANIWRLMQASTGRFEFGSEDVWSLFHSCAFDLSVWELWGAFLFGGRVVIVPYWVSRSPDEFYALLKREGVTVLTQTPSAFGELMRVDAECWRGADDDLKLRTIIFAGEALGLEKLRGWMRRHGDRKPTLVNMYGITETTVHVTYREIVQADLDGDLGSPIGIALDDLRVYVLDRAMNQAPAGVVGEMYVGGGGVAREYLGKPALTASRFLPDPYGGEAGARMYRSGDLARWTETGELDYLGRADQQVKIRGFRVELGEVEAVLARHPGVEHCAVVLCEQAAGPVLSAYCVPSASVAGPVKRIVEQLQHEGLSPGSLVTLANGMVVSGINKTETQFLYKEIFEEQEYSLKTAGLPDDAVIVDIGAHIGMFTLYVAGQVQDARIYAIEPMPATFEALRRNCEIHGVHANLRQCAVGGQEGHAQFVYYPKLTILSGRYAASSEDEGLVRSYVLADSGESEGLDELLREWLQGETIDCPVITVSRLIDEEQLNRIDLLKIDAEKSEWEILEGVREEHWPLVRNVFMEIHDQDDRVARSVYFLRERGFEVETSQAAALRDTGLHNLRAHRAETRTAHAGRQGSRSNEITWRSPELLRSAILSFARENLPAYMVPAGLTFIDQIPLTTNGKLDRRALPDPWRENIRQFEPPRTPAEATIADIWDKALGRTGTSVNEHFVEIGGHSLTAAQIVSRASKTFGVKVPIRIIFEHPTIAEFAEAVEHLVIDDIANEQGVGQIA
jgi:amino acid adenylation domain-containing protein/FkbM family methyltransferase